MKQFRIGIIGTENSHAWAFTKFFNQPDDKGNFAYPDCHVTLVYGHYPEESRKTVEQYGADAVAESIEQMVANVDAVMITARDGKYHAEFARPFIEAGIPAFVDKPFTVDPAEAVALVRLAKEKGVPLCGGSSLKYADSIQAMKAAAAEMGGKLIGATAAAPLNMHNEYSGFFFYSSHLAEMTMEMFGWQPKSIMAVENNDSVCAIVNYDGFSVSNNFNNGAYVYAVSLYGSQTRHADIDISMCGKAECDVFVEMLRTGKMSHTYEELIAPVLYLNAVKTSYETGRLVEIDYPEI